MSAPAHIALCRYPRSRPLRSLYYVATALGALQDGEVMLASRYELSVLPAELRVVVPRPTT